MSEREEMRAALLARRERDGLRANAGVEGIEILRASDLTAHIKVVHDEKVTQEAFLAETREKLERLKAAAEREKG